MAAVYAPKFEWGCFRREKRERRLDEISEELLASDGRGMDARLREIEDFVLGRMKDLNGLLAGEIPRAKAETAKHSGCLLPHLFPKLQKCVNWRLLIA
jgi:hypothetical protein